MKRWLAEPAVLALVPLGLVLLLGAIFNQNGAFFEWATHRAMLREISVHGILACGMTLVIISGGIDLSVGSVLGLCAVLFALLSLPLRFGSGVTVFGVLAVGAVLGLISGLLVARARLQAFIVTLAMMVFARGLAKQLSGGKKITSYIEAGASIPYPEIWSALDTRILGGQLAVVSVIFFACALISHLVLSRLRLGRYLYAVGGNPDAARLAGVPVRATLTVAYVISGLFAAIAGLCQAAQETHGDPETGTGYELDAIAIVVLGGTSLLGGRGSIPQTLLGALTLGYLQKVLSLNAFSTESRLMLMGAIIVGAVLFQRRLQATDD
jgi:ribose transport system permease protein